MANAVIDLDDLCKVYPFPERSFARNNLKAVWPNFTAIPELKLVIPSVIADEEELVQLRESVPGARFAVCELTAPEDVLKERVTAREPNEYWQGRLRNFVDLFLGRGRPLEHPGLRGLYSRPIGRGGGARGHREGRLATPMNSNNPSSVINQASSSRSAPDTALSRSGAPRMPVFLATHARACAAGTHAELHFGAWSHMMLDETASQDP